MSQEKQTKQDVTKNYLPNHNTKWQQAEKQRALELKKEGKTYDEIAEILKRTKEAVRVQIQQLVLTDKKLKIKVVDLMKSFNKHAKPIDIEQITKELQHVFASNSVDLSQQYWQTYISLVKTMLEQSDTDDKSSYSQSNEDDKKDKEAQILLTPRNFPVKYSNKSNDNKQVDSVLKLKEELNTLKEESEHKINQLQNQISAYKNEINDKLNGFKMTKREQNAKNNQLIEYEKLLKNKLHELENKYNNSQKEKQEMALQIKTLQSEMDNIDKQNKELINKYNNINNDYNMELTVKQLYKDEIKSLNEKYQIKCGECIRLHEKNNQFEIQNINLMSERKVINDEITLLNEKLNEIQKKYQIKCDECIRLNGINNQFEIKSCIWKQMSTFIGNVAFKALKHLMSFVICVAIVAVLIFFFQDINGQSIEMKRYEYYISPKPLIRRYFSKINSYNDSITQYNDIDTPLNTQIIDAWTEYLPKYEEYYKAYKKQIFYATETYDKTIHQLVLIGVTGSGKSLFANRLSGYQGNNDSNGYFGVSGNVDSCTVNISKLIVYNLYKIDISILDTPGIYDSDDNDIANQHNLVKYLKGSDGVNAFILVLKKERLSKSIKDMLKEFQKKFGDAFWSHLIIVINFWNERDRNNWNEWKIDFINKIRKYFGLRNKQRFPLNIVGLNNFGSYRLEIIHDLISNIPSNRLNCYEFKSPFESLKNDTFKLYEKIEQLMNDRNDNKKQLKQYCDSLSKIAEELEYFKTKKKINEINNIIDTKCRNTSEKIDKIEQELKNKVILNDDNKFLMELQSSSIDYKDENNLLYKFNYLSDMKGRRLLNCVNKTEGFENNIKLSNVMKSVIKNSKYSSQLITSTSIYDECAKMEMSLTYCNDENEKLDELIDDGWRFKTISKKPI